MKTQIIKIIPCLLAGFILSACVGAVNIPSDVAEKKTEPDPVVEKDTMVIVDDKEPEPEPEPVIKKDTRRMVNDGDSGEGDIMPVIPPDPCVVDPASCVVEYADWLAIFDNPIPTIAIPNGVNVLQGTPTGLDITGVAADISINEDPAILHTLTLATAMNSGVTFNGDATDGVAFFNGYPSTRNSNGTRNYNSNGQRKIYYFGILSDTNLGAPLIQTSGRVSWRGHFISEGSSNDISVNTDFILNISFGVADSAGTIVAFVRDNSGTSHYRLTGEFNTSGVIQGYVEHGTFINNLVTDPFPKDNIPSPTCSCSWGASVTGIIGQEGAVVAFESSKGYSGGFVAVPPSRDRLVTYGDWSESFTTPLRIIANTATRQSQFLQGTATGINMGGDFAFRAGSLNLATARFGGDVDDGTDGVAFDGDAEDGVAYYSWDNGNSDEIFYATILSGTNLGEPLPEFVSGNTATAEWNGQFNVLGFRDNANADTDFILDVNYEERSVEAFVNAGHVHYLLKGTYDIHGVITGTTERTRFGNGLRNMIDLNYNERISGILTGLIGKQGAVGVFVSNKTEIYGGYGGGFVAVPPE